MTNEYAYGIDHFYYRAAAVLRPIRDRNQKIRNTGSGFLGARHGVLTADA